MLSLALTGEMAAEQAQTFAEFGFKTHVLKHDQLISEKMKIIADSYALVMYADDTTRSCMACVDVGMALTMGKKVFVSYTTMNMPLQSVFTTKVVPPEVLKVCCTPKETVQTVIRTVVESVKTGSSDNAASSGN